MTYGCHNREEYVPSYLAQSGWVTDKNDGMIRHSTMIPIPVRMARDCQYTKTTLGQADPKCEGCKHRLKI